ncbi:MAG: hypothetical protein GKS01_09030 [Alphaproteobacteria bacterium]|nr:hypothetical protein [Alphaproteobacteria bacterium]
MAPQLASDSALSERIDGLSEHLIKNLPNNEDLRERAIVERALQYATETEQQIAAQRERIAELESLSSTEPLTNLPNRRGFEGQFNRVIARARRFGETGVVGTFPDLLVARKSAAAVAPQKTLIVTAVVDGDVVYKATSLPFGIAAAESKKDTFVRSETPHVSLVPVCPEWMQDDKCIVIY